MRKFNFRVWDNKNKTFLTPESKGSYFLRSDGILEWQNATMGGLDPSGKISYCSINYPLTTKNYVIQLFTGIKDKNGREIYVNHEDIDSKMEVIGNIFEK